MIRKIVFWTHLCTGVAGAVVILMMSVTGVILTYERQMIAMEDSVYEREPGADEEKLTLDQLVTLASESGDIAPTRIIVSNNPAAPVILSEGRSNTRYVDAYTAQEHTPHSDTIGGFMSSVRGLHRWFLVSGDGRATARDITGAANLMFLVLVITGIYLWLPGIINSTTMRLRLWFHPNAREGAARDFNWHHVFGFWFAIPLIVIISTATVFNYPWANNLVYRLAGDEPPQRSASASTPAESQTTTAPSMELESLFNIASRQLESWNRITINLPEDPVSADITFTIDQGNGGEPQKRHNLILDKYSGEVSSWIPFNTLPSGRQARSWVRFLHTGEALGITGQTIAGLASGAGALMVWTGLALALRRFLRFLRRTRINADRNKLKELVGTEPN